MDQTTLRPKPMPGRRPGGPSDRNPSQCQEHDHDQGVAPDKRSGKQSGRGRRPHAARRRGRRLLTLLSGLLLAAVLVLAGVGLGTVGATVIGMSKLAEMQKAAAGRGADGPKAPGAPNADPKAPGVPATGPTPPTAAAPVPPGPVPSKPQAAPAPHADPAAPARTATLGVEAVDAPGGAGALLVGVHIPGPGYTAGLVRGDTVLTFGKRHLDSAAELATAVRAARPGKEVALTVRHTSGTRQTLTIRPGIVT
ncbi:PDZ domain-containing protein [Streptomyces sp. NPDC005562]|uniref:PDZ domain-containing protein n=1 Tax=Streptomyces sp. NPDC005562 TaxID=3154890 RepID=UPI0033B5563F